MKNLALLKHLLPELVEVLEAEVWMGEKLLDNLARQKEALLAWDSSTFLQHVEEKEVLLRELGSLEKRRQKLLLRFSPLCKEPPSLRGLSSSLSSGPERERLELLRERLSHTYGRLRLEEKRLTGLLENLLGHVREALVSLSPTSLSLYGRQGAQTLPLPVGLIQGKA